jgi:hypothetical protein
MPGAEWNVGVLAGQEDVNPGLVTIDMAVKPSQAAVIL